MVSLGSFKISLPLFATVLIFLIAGLLSIVLRARRSLGAYRIPWRPAFSFHLVNARQLAGSVKTDRVLAEMEGVALTALFSGLGVIAKATADRVEENEGNISLTESCAGVTMAV